MKKKLGICGDSFMASVIKDEKNLNNGYGKHFTEVLAKMLDCELITYARKAISNQAIRLQIDEVIKDNPDYVIIGTTTPDRIEVPINDVTVENYMQKWKVSQYNFENGLYNIRYNGYENQSELNNKFMEINPKFISSTITHLINEKCDLKEDTIEAIKSYFQYIYDMNWKRQLDTWIISDGIQKLIRSNMRFSLITPQIEYKYFDYCFDNIIYGDNPLNPWTYYSQNESCEYPFHISEKNSNTLAEHWYKKLKTFFI